MILTLVSSLSFNFNQHALGSVHRSRCIPKMLPNTWSGFAAILMGGGKGHRLYAANWI